MLISQHIENIFEDFLTRRTLARKTRHRLPYTSINRRFNSKTSKMSICVWKYLRKTITSMTENNLHQEHRRLEKKNCSSFNSSIRKSFAASRHLAHELLIRLRFFWATRDLENSPKIDTSKKKTSLSSHHRRQPLKSTVRKFVQHFDT